ncbi:MAG: HD domain-containing protein [archaeon]|nr:HD domain-containing protein [Candidatus Micrarchaeota archaeon]
MGLIEFFHKVKKLRELKRKGWKDFGVENPESVADHSFRVALMTLIFSEKMKLNTEKALKMALIHDLCEVYSGDLAAEEKISREKYESEEKGMKKIVSELNEREGEELMDLWKEFMEGKSREARIVREIDRLEMGFSAVEYEKEQKKGKEFVNTFIPFVEKSLKEKELTELFNELKKELK